MATRNIRGLSGAPYLRLKKGEDDTIPISELYRIVEAIQKLQALLAGGLTFGDGTSSSGAGNFKGQIIDYYFELANTDYLIPHGLRSRPTGFVVILQNFSGKIHDVNFGAGWGNTYIQLRAPAAATRAKMLLFG